MKHPKSMEECVYFTNRTLEPKGRVTSWVFKNYCPKCKKGLMSKPKDEKTGKPKIRAKEYVCEKCGNTIEKKEYEESLTAYADYVCPNCGKQGESESPFKRKNVKGVPTLRFTCQHCGGNVDVTKKMKKPR